MRLIPNVGVDSNLTGNDYIIPHTQKSNTTINKIKFDKSPTAEWATEALRFLLKFCPGYDTELYEAHSAKRSNAVNAGNLGFTVDEMSLMLSYSFAI